jgi:hypothetical protein
MDNSVVKDRAWAWHKQGLDGSRLGQDAARVLAETGWMRSVGGANPYLGLWARAGMDREQVDKEVAALAIHELPVVRGCTYVLGAGDFAWGLQLGAAAAGAAAKVLDKLGVDRAETAGLEEKVLGVLADGALDPRQLKDRLGVAVRSLGEEGRKKGAATTLPAVLGLLQADGRIRRVPVNGRLDQQRYSYAAWGLAPSPYDDGEARAQLLRRYLSWTGGATLKQTQWFSAFTVAQTKAALAACGAVETVRDGAEALWRLPEDQAAYEEFAVPGEEQIQLLAGTDGMTLLRRNAFDLFDPADRERAVPGDKQSLALQADLPDHPILDRGRIIGLWQYDPEHARIVAWTFEPATAAVRQRTTETEAYIRDQLGDFRSFSLDSPASRAKRISGLQAAASG